MSSRASTLCLCALALVGSAFAADPTYSGLKGIPGLSYTITSSPAEGDAYKAKTEGYEEVVLEIQKDGADLAAYDKVELRLCFSATDIVDRPWRKFKDVIKKDKQCKSTADDAALITWDIADIPATYNWKVKDVQPIATRSFRLLALKDGVYTGSMGECKTTEGAETCVWSGDKFVGKDAPADKFVKVTAYDGLESGIVVAAVILSIVSVAILLGYFAYERLVVAKRE